MKKIKTQTKTKKNKNKNKRGSHKNRIHKKTIRKGGMFSALRGLFGRSSASSAVRGEVLPPAAPGAGMEEVLPPAAPGAGMEEVLPPAAPGAGMEAVLPPAAPGDKRKREEEQVCWVCLETFSEDNIRDFGPKIGCIGTIPHYAHEKCVSKWCDGVIKYNDGLCRCACQALINLPENIINAKFILPSPPREQGDANSREYPHDPTGKVPEIFQRLEKRKNAGHPYTITKYEKAQDNIGIVFTRADLGPEDVSISIRNAIITRATAGDEYALNVLERLANKSFTMPTNFFITRATAGDKYALNVLERLANKGFSVSIEFFITRANAKDEYAIKVLEELATKYEIVRDFFVAKAQAGEEYAINSLATLAIDYGLPAAINFFKVKSNAGEKYALDVLGKAASKGLIEALEFLYMDTKRFLHPSEQLIDGMFILLAPPSNNVNSAISKYGIRRWPIFYYIKEEKLIEFNIKMPRSWWERSNGENLPLGWYTKKIYVEAPHIVSRDVNATEPEYKNKVLEKPGTVLYNEDDYQNDLKPPVWVSSRRR